MSLQLELMWNLAVLGAIPGIFPDQEEEGVTERIQCPLQSRNKSSLP